MTLNVKNFVNELVVSQKYTKNQAEAQKEKKREEKIIKKTYFFLKLGIEHTQKKIYHI